MMHAIIQCRKFKGSRHKGGSEAATIGSLDEFAGQLGDSTSIINVNNDDFQRECFCGGYRISVAALVTRA